MKIKAAALVLLALVLIFAGVVVYGWLGASVQVTGISMTRSSADAHGDTFRYWQNALDNGSATGGALTDALPGGAEDYAFFAYLLHLKNGGLLDMEMLEVQLSPANGDALYYTAENAEEVNRVYSLSSGQSGDYQVVLLTSAQNLQNSAFARDFLITYYVWGIPFTVRAQYK